MSKKDKLNCKSVEKRTECVCPKCEKKHFLKIYYTGTGIPKKYCNLCNGYVQKYDFRNDSLYA